MKAIAICGQGAAILLLVAAPAIRAQDSQPEEEVEEPRRTRIGLGVQLVPSYPGSDSVSVRPLIDVSRERGDAPFPFEAPDESFGFPVWERNGWAVGPAIGLEGSRSGDDVGTELPKVGFTVEVGGFVQYELSSNLRARVEVRQGLGGHEGLIATAGADYVIRNRDDWLFSIGPRLTLADDKYQDAYFSIEPEDSTAAGLTAYSAGSGVQAVGVTAGYLRQLTPRWGIYSYAKYDRLVGDAADSPIVRQFGSRDQFSGGLALTYTFGGGRD
jgi:outer membrane scaffolding protein for murein synthesis (MipA/OmpV family)